MATGITHKYLSENHLNNTKLIGICGREGSGKTTIANQLIKQTYKMTVVNAEKYVMQTLFTDKDNIWGLTYEQALEKILALFRKNIDPNFKFPEKAQAPEYEYHTNYVDLSFATPLKKIASIVFNIDYEILLGETAENRKLRETVETDSVVGKLTGRKCLEYLGTEVFRNQFDPDFWIKIFNRDMQQFRNSGYNVVIADVRFKNEFEYLQQSDAILLVVFRDEKDLVLTDADRATHPAKWQFLECIPNIKNIYKIHNCGTIQQLIKKCENSFNFNC